MHTGLPHPTAPEMEMGGAKSKTPSQELGKGLQGRLGEGNCDVESIRAPMLWCPETRRQRRCQSAPEMELVLQEFRRTVEQQP
mmetsp:Transcript_14539/g.36916  ORF Transcript_14539/g.36916 Transcript_14539/m.36916 type:complete len:83 (-) Transcript_14539:4079-4327(-)